MKPPEQLRAELAYVLNFRVTHGHDVYDELLALIEREKKAAVEEALRKHGINVYSGPSFKSLFPKLPPEADAHTKQRAKEIGDYVTEYFKK